MELKFRSLSTLPQENGGSNRTFMELKFEKETSLSSTKTEF